MPAELKERIKTEDKQGKDFSKYNKAQYWSSNNEEYN